MTQEYIPATPPAPVPEITDTEKMYQYTQSQRLMMYQAIIPNQASIQHQDPKLLAIAQRALDGIDKQQLTRERMATDKDIATNDQETARLLNSVAEQMSSVSPFRLPEASNNAVPAPELPTPTLAPGVLEEGVSNICSKDFQ